MPEDLAALHEKADSLIEKLYGSSFKDDRARLMAMIRLYKEMTLIKELKRRVALIILLDSIFLALIKIKLPLCKQFVNFMTQSNSIDTSSFILYSLNNKRPDMIQIGRGGNE